MKEEITDLRMKIGEIASKIFVNPTEIIDFLKSKKIQVKSNSSKIGVDEQREVYAHFVPHELKDFEKRIRISLEEKEIESKKTNESESHKEEIEKKNIIESQPEIHVESAIEKREEEIEKKCEIVESVETEQVLINEESKEITVTQEEPPSLLSNPEKEVHLNILGSIEIPSASLRGKGRKEERQNLQNDKKDSKKDSSKDKGKSQQDNQRSKESERNQAERREQQKKSQQKSTHQKQELPKIEKIEPEIKSLPIEPPEEVKEISFIDRVEMKGLTQLGEIDASAATFTTARKKSFRQQALEYHNEYLKEKKKERKEKQKNDSEQKEQDKKDVKKPVMEVAPTGTSKTKKEKDAEIFEEAKKKVSKKQIFDKEKIDRNIKNTIYSDALSEVETRQKFRKIKKQERERKEEQAELQRVREEKIVRTSEFVSTSEYAGLLGVSSKEVIEKCFKMGKLITINQRLDKEIIEILALEFGKEVIFVSEEEEVEVFETENEILQKRPPVVTIMGHVDHGKTSLLDFIRRTNVVSGESGGITQHIGAYEVRLDNGEKITFLDTPGHEVFTAMRARGTELTDIVVLVVAANDSVMPQTLEAISHAKIANVPIVVAINKIDLPGINIEKIKQQLSEAGVLVEEWGGDAQCQQISAKKGLGIKELLEKIVVQADLMNLKADYNENNLVRGVIVEAALDKGKGVVATVLVQNGILKTGDIFLSGHTTGKIRAMLNERGQRVEIAYPSQPVTILGFEQLPEVGDAFITMTNDREAKEIARRRQVTRREQLIRATTSSIKLEEISRGIQSGEIKDLKLILKGDTAGSIEAIADKAMKFSTNEFKVVIIHKGVGQVNETDVLLALASKAIIISFRVRANLNANRLVAKEGIDIRYYTVIYHAIEEIQAAIEGMLSPEISEKITGTVEIRQVYKVSNMGNVAGCHVLDGKITRDARIRLVRDGIAVFEGTIASLKRFKDDAKEVETGYECGITLKGYDDIKAGDIIEPYEVIETKRKLDMNKM